MIHCVVKDVSLYMAPGMLRRAPCEFLSVNEYLRHDEVRTVPGHSADDFSAHHLALLDDYRIARRINERMANVVGMKP